MKQIGYVAIDQDGNPYQPTIGGLYEVNQRTKPITVYKDPRYARKISPVNNCATVYMEIVNNNGN